MQAGLGGGSADAAAALLGLGRLWGGAPPALLREIAADLGADVRVLSVGRHGAGPRARRGDLSAGRFAAARRRRRPAAVRRLDRRGVPLVRRGPCGRAQGSARAAEAAGARGRRARPRWSTTSSRRWCGGIRRSPRLRTILREAGAVAAAMTGSGSAVFGLFRSRAAAASALAPLSKGGVRALVTRTLSRAEYERRSRPVARAARRTAPRSPAGIDRAERDRVHLPFCGRARRPRRAVRFSSSTLRSRRRPGSSGGSRSNGRSGADVGQCAWRLLAGP